MIVAGSAAFLLLASAPPQVGCNLPSHTDWIRAGMPKGEGRAVAQSLVHPVIVGLPRAVASLRSAPVRPLTADQAVTFAGPQLRAKLQQAGPGLKPYLIRAVYPTGYPSFDVRWHGDDLYVHGGGLGCAAFTNRPIIILLRRAPKRLFVAASAAL